MGDVKKIPKKAHKVLEDLDYLVDTINYYCSHHPTFFRKEILPKVRNIEDYIKTRARNQKEVFKEIANRYEKLYEQKLQNALEKIEKDYE